MNRTIVVGDFFHVSKNFHPSYFRPMQLVSLYWQVELAPGERAFEGHSEPQALEQEGYYYRLQWIPLDQLNPEFFTTPLDQEVAEKLLSEFR